MASVLQRGPRQAPAHDPVHRQVAGEVGRGAKAPAARDLRQLDAAMAVMRRERREAVFDIGAFRQLRRERLDIHRPAGREDHGLHDAAPRWAARSSSSVGSSDGRRSGGIGHGSSRLRRR